QFYALESSALFNPAIVISPHHNPDDKKLNFILSLRAVGEGHISSIVFREGIIDENFEITLKDPLPFIMEPQKKLERPYDKTEFIRNLSEAGAINEISESVLNSLPEKFNFEELNTLLDTPGISFTKYDPFVIKETISIMRNLALS